MGEVTHRGALARRLHDEQFGTEEFVRSLDAPGRSAARGRRSCAAAAAARGSSRLEGPGRPHPRSAITGDFFLSPSRAALDLEADLRAVAAADAGAAVEAFFARLARPVGLSPLDFREVVESARADQAHRRRPRKSGVFKGVARAGCRPSSSARRARQRAAVARLPRPARALYRLRRPALRPLGLGRVGTALAALFEGLPPREALALGGLSANPHFASNPDRPVRRASIALAYAGNFPERVRA